MGNRRDIVLTAYGHDEVIDKIALNVFDGTVNQDGQSNDAVARTYCDTINNLELNGNTWVFAQIVSENIPFSLNSILPLKFDIILSLDDRAVQKMMREIDSFELVKALKGAEETIKQKIFRNMTERAALMLKEDIEYLGPLPARDVKASREKIINIIRHLHETGEIVISYSEGDTVK
jgi:flagellar motor switch protein FliG